MPDDTISSLQKDPSQMTPQEKSTYLINLKKEYIKRLGSAYDQFLEEAAEIKEIDKQLKSGDAPRGEANVS